MNFVVEKDSAVPYYHQIKLGVRSMITCGDLKAGDMLPSETSLAEQWGISRLVVHRAFRELVSEGLLVRKRSVGTFVAPPTGHTYAVTGPLMSITEQGEAYGVHIGNQVLKQEVVPAPSAVSGSLAMPEGAAAVHLVNLRTIQGMPLCLEDTYLPAGRFPLLADTDLNDRSLYAALRELYDAYPTRAVDILGAGIATREEARLLGIIRGSAVLRAQRTSIDKNGNPVEYTVSVLHAERFRFIVRIDSMLMGATGAPEPITTHGPGAQERR